MREIDCPTYKSADVLNDCIKIRRDLNLKERLNCIAVEIASAEKIYAQKGAAHSFHDIKPTVGVGTCVSTSEMEGLYTEVFARKTSPIRVKYYDELILAPQNGTCPFCGQRNVSTLDHYLPKAKHPALAVTPINLVPSCKDCNHVKDEHSPRLEIEQLLHPYFDKIPEGVWLVAHVETSRPPALVYRIQTPPVFDPVLTKRLEWQFRKLDIGKLYAAQAGSMLSGIASKLTSAWARGGSDEIKLLLEDDAKSWGKHHSNCWQAAMYRALASSEWFCGEGFAYAGEKPKKKQPNHEG